MDCRCSATILCLSALSSTAAAAGSHRLARSTPPVRNVIFLIPDGMSTQALTLARWYAGGKPLAIDPLACGLVHTHAADAPVTDSAPAATAMATGFKSHAGYIGVLPERHPLPGSMTPLPAESDGTPVATLLEAARLSGKRVGLVATSEIMHATPAGFSAHHRDRNAFEQLVEQQVYNGIDVALGGGASYLKSQNRSDREDLVGELRHQGYAFVSRAQELRASDPAKTPRLWGLFAEKDLTNDLERDDTQQPSLAEMTHWAIESLRQGKQGFFLLVEGSKIDWGAHDNDPFAVVSETLGFDKAVAVALDFARKDGKTAIVIASDHNTGGMSINNQKSGYDTAPLASYLTSLRKVKASVRTVAPLVRAKRENTMAILTEKLGIEYLTDAEKSSVDGADEGQLPYVLSDLVSHRASIGWATFGHSGEDVPLFMYHPKGRILTGTVQNTDLAHFVEVQLGLDLTKTSSRLYMEIPQGLKGLDAQLSWDRTDEANPVRVVSTKKATARFPINKNFVEISGRRVMLPGITVADGERVWVSQDALAALTKH